MKSFRDFVESLRDSEQTKFSDLLDQSYFSFLSDDASTQSFLTHVLDTINSFEFLTLLSKLIGAPFDKESEDDFVDRCSQNLRRLIENWSTVTNSETTLEIIRNEDLDLSSGLMQILIFQSSDEAGNIESPSMASNQNKTKRSANSYVTSQKEVKQEQHEFEPELLE